MQALLRYGAIVLVSAGPAICVAQLGHGAAEAAHVLSPAASTAAQVSPHLNMISTRAFQTHASSISKVRQETLTPQQLSKFTAPQQTQLRSSAERLARANQVFVATNNSMRPKQRLLADMQIQLATDALRKTATVRSPGAPPPPMLAQGPTVLSVGAATAAQAINQPPLGVEVFVRAGPGRPADAMDVYVLPIGLVQYGGDLDVSQIRNVIDGLLFKTPTSPAQGDLEPGYIYAVWVGSRNAAGAMAQKVKDQKVAYHTIDTSNFKGPFTINFDAAEQVVAP